MTAQIVRGTTVPRAENLKHLKSHPVEHNVHITAAGSVEFRRTIIYLTQSLRPLLGANVCPGGKGGEGHVFGAGGPAKPWWAKCWNFAVCCGLWEMQNCVSCGVSRPCVQCAAGKCNAAVCEWCARTECGELLVGGAAAPKRAYCVDCQVKHHIDGVDLLESDVGHRTSRYLRCGHADCTTWTVFRCQERVCAKPICCNFDHQKFRIVGRAGPEGNDRRFCAACSVSRCVGEGLGHAAQHCQWQYVALGAHLVGSPSLHWHYLAISSSSVSLCPTTTGATQAVVTPSTGNRCPTDRLPVVGEAQAAQPPGAWVLPVAPGQAVHWQAMPPLRDTEESEPRSPS